VLFRSSNVSWEEEMKNKIPQCFKENVFHHGKLSKINLTKPKNMLIMIDEIDTGDKEGQKLNETLENAGLLDINYMKENNIYIIFVSATIYKELKELKKWGDKHSYISMTIPETYISHKDFLEMDIIKEFYNINSVKKAEIWIDEDILNNYNEEIDSNITLLKNEKKELESNLNTIRDSQAIINVKLQQIAENKTLVDQLYSEFEELNNHIGDLQYLAYMFGKNGIPSLEIENSFSQIQDEINSFLRSISKFDVIFKPDKELKTWEENCLSCNFIYPKNYKKHNCEKCHEPRKRKRKDEIQLSIVDNENEIGFEMCSGGIKTLISLAVRTAMTLLLKRTNGLNLDVLFLDEIDSAIDKKNKPLISDFVNSLCQNLGFKQVLWISHDRNISSNVDNTLLVTSNGTYSKVAWL